MTHNDLASNLAIFLQSKICDNRVTWENISFSDWSKENGYSCRPDVFSIMPVLDVDKSRPWTHEVKVTRADFISDIRAEKWKKYTKFSCRVFYAAPKGLIDSSELPSGPGLWEYDSFTDDWSLTKAAKYNKGWELTSRSLMKLILGRWGTYQGQLKSDKR